MRINVYTYITMYIIVTTIGTCVTLFFFSAALSLDIKTILLGIQRKTRTYNNINVAIETYGVHLEPFEYNKHTCLTAVVSAYCIKLYILYVYHTVFYTYATYIIMM